MRGDEKPETPAGAACVLLIEDDDLVRDTFEEALCSRGHLVTAVSRGSEGVAAIDRRGFDLVITDLSMPGMSGIELARRVKLRDPSIRVILVSGWTGGQEQGALAAGDVDRVLHKPCSIDELIGAVNEALAAPRPTPTTP